MMTILSAPRQARGYGGQGYKLIQSSLRAILSRPRRDRPEANMTYYLKKKQYGYYTNGFGDAEVRRPFRTSDAETASQDEALYL